MKLFFITSRFPYPIEKGDKLRVYYQLIELSRYFDVYLFALAEVRPSDQEYNEIKKYCREINIVVHPKWKSIVSVLGLGWASWPLQTRYFYSRKLDRVLISEVERVKPDHIHFHLIRTTEYLKSEHHRSTLDFMDSFSLGLEGLIDKVGRSKRLVYKIERRLVEKYEHQVAPRFAKTFIISDRDRNHIDSEKRLDISILKNGIDMDFFKSKNVKKTYDIVFVGNLGYPPNIEAVKLINTLARRQSSWRILIAGARSEALSGITLAPNIHMMGWVDDIRDAYCSGRVFLAPIHHGSGLQNKILEAMSLGLPCVTTSFVNQAIDAVSNKEIVIADTIEEMEQSILELFNNREFMQNMAAAGHKFVSEKYTWSEKTKPLIDYIKNKEL